jgi:EAL domain-containing protein (putative c-di-GMP-specific phosphodiesterase class I)
MERGLAMDDLAAVVGIMDGASDPLSAAVTARDRETLAMVREALDRGRLALAFQPVVIASDPTRIAFHEGLIRIMDESGRPIPAREFMGAVETRDLGRLIDCASLELGLRTLADVPGLRLSINMSARSIGYPRWTRTLEAGLARDPTVAERLILEITESSAMLMPELVTAFMGDLQRRGIAFALDDFGAGFTSFRYLRDFWFDMLKIEGSFIRGIATDPDNQVLVEALTAIGRHFDMVVVAESVESAEDAAWLTAAGIDALQGYFYGAPTERPAWMAGERRRA